MTSNEVALPSQQRMEVGIADPPPAGEVGDLVQWAYEARQAGLIAAALVQSSFVPRSLKDRPNDVAIAILAGHELGLMPMATLRSIDIVQGTPALRAIAMRGLLQSRGHEIELVESDDDHCVMRGRRKGAQSWQTVEWDLPRAKRLGIAGREQWTKQPRTMLIARATGELCRLVASDLLQAMPYTAEEMADSADDVPPPPRVTAADLASQGVRASGDSGEPPPAPDPTSASPTTTPAATSKPPAEDKPSTQRQQGEIHRLAGLLGLSTKPGEREEYLALLNEAAARPDSGQAVSSKDLTRKQAGWVIEIWTKKVEAAPAAPEPPPEPEPPVNGEPDDLFASEYWQRLVAGAAQRGYTEAQIRAGLEEHYAQPVEDLTQGEIQAYTTKVALGTAHLPDLP